MGKFLVTSVFILFCYSSMHTQAFAIVGYDKNELAFDHPVKINTLALVKKENNKYKVFCSGNLVTTKHIFTARHCLDVLEQFETFVYFGNDTNNIDQSLLRKTVFSKKLRQEIDLEQSFPTFDFGFVEFAGELPRNSKTNEVQFKPIKIFNQPDKLNGSEEFIIAGFGISEISDRVVFGKKRWLKPKSIEMVESQQFKNIIILNSEKGKGSCYGDSGGPLYIKWQGQWYLLGVTSGFDISLTPKSYKLVDSKDKEYAPVCEGGESVYNYVGNYVSWVNDLIDEQVTSISQNYQNQVESDLVQQGVHSFSWWCESSSVGDKYWLTIRQLLYFASDSVDNKNKKQALIDCEYAESILNEFKKIRFDSDSFFSDLTPLIGLNSLKQVEFIATQIPELNSFASSNLTHIKLKDLSLTDLKVIESLAGLATLESLDLTNNSLSDIDALLDFHQVKELKLGGNQIKNIDVLSQFKDLQVLELYANDIESIDSLLQLSELKELLVSKNKITSPLSAANWPLLELAFFNNNKINDFGFLKNSKSIKKLKVYNQD